MTNRYNYFSFLRPAILSFALILFFWLGLDYTALSQADITTIIPPSPNASSLGQYGEIPVSYYTGTPSINIPLYEVKGRQLSVPISLSYHASGVKVNQRPGHVGLGWALNAGGVITRSIVGKPDEFGGAGYNDIAPKLYQYTETGVMTIEEKEDFLENCASGKYDTQPDIYYYNFLGFSGKMVLDQFGHEHLIPHKKIKVSHVENGFLFTVTDGTKYYFQDSERSRLVTDDPDSGPVYTADGITAWYLSKIISPSGDEIVFSYFHADRGLSESYDLYPGETQKIYLGESGFTKISTCDGDQFPIAPMTYLEVQNTFLTEISSATSKIKFKIEGVNEAGIPEKLTTIEIYNKSDTTYFERTFEFNYSSIDPDRPRLNLIKERAVNEDKPPYQFVYNETPLPEYGSKAQDHWGFYNGKSSNSYLIPEQEYNGKLISGADRNPDAIFGMAGILEEIKFPTGGKTLFEYEGHDYSTGDSIPVTTDAHAFITAENSNTVYTTIDIDADQWVSFHASAIVPDWMQSEEGEAVGNVFLYADSQCDFRNVDQSFAFESGMSTKEETRVKVCAGQKLTLMAESFENGGSVTGIVHFEAGTGAYKRIFQAGGVRIKKIINYSGNDELKPARIQRFEYRDGDFSSGELVTRYLHYNNYYYELNTGVNWGGTVPLPATCRFYVLNSSNRSVLGSSQGGHIGYSKVSVYQDEFENSGKTVFEYTSTADYPDWINQSAGTTTSFAYKRGLLLRQTDYGYRNLASIKLRSIENKYHFDENQKFELIGLGVKFKSQDNFTHEILEFYEGNYKHISQWYYASEQIDNWYDLEGLDSLVKTTTYHYDNNTHLQPTRIVTTQSDGKTSSVQLKYADDLAHTVMTDAHMHSQVLERTTIVDELVTHKKTTQYTQVSGHILPTLFTTYPNGGSESVEAKYSYDEYGNVIQIEKQNERVTSLLWGYDGTYPVAKVENASYADLPAIILANIQSLSNADNDHCLSTQACKEQDLRTALQDLRDDPDLAGALITTYTYDPLMGMTSQTDPNGTTTYYEYDDFGRLHYTKDLEGNVLQRYDYNYKQ